MASGRNEYDQLYVINPTTEPFRFRWGGQDHNVPPQKQIIMPRFLAEHFAKKLTDHILLTKEAEHKKKYLAEGGSLKDYQAPSYLYSKKLRPEVLRSILKGTYSYQQSMPTNDPTALAQQELERQLAGMNNPQQNPQQQQQEEANTLDLGEEGDRLQGALQDDDEDEELPEIPTAPQVPPNQVPLPPQPAPAPNLDPPQSTLGNPPMPPAPLPPAPSTPPAKETGVQKLNRLRKEAKTLGIKNGHTMNTEQLEAEIKKQYA